MIEEWRPSGVFPSNGQSLTGFGRCSAEEEKSKDSLRLTGRPISFNVKLCKRIEQPQMLFEMRVRTIPGQGERGTATRDESESSTGPLRPRKA